MGAKSKKTYLPVNNKSKMKINSEVSKCIICSSKMKLHFSDLYDDRYGYDGKFDLYRCPCCGQYKTVPLLKEQELTPLYSNYYPRKNIDTNAICNQAQQSKKVLSNLIRWWKGNNNQGQYFAKKGEIVLDYGCGSGLSLIELNLIGAKGYGIEADQNIRQVIERLKLNIHIGSLEPDTFGNTKFDLIILNQVIEHIPDPSTLINTLLNHLKNNGRIILSFPNSNSFYANFFKRKWINWHIPYHLHHFNLESSVKYFQNLGWSIDFKKCITPNLWTIIQSKVYWEEISLGNKSIFWSSFSNTKLIKKDLTFSEKIIYIISHHSSSKTIYIIISLFNRILDLFGRGDSILICINRNN